MAQKFNGTGVALVTPFKQNGAVDFGALEKLIRFNIDGGIDYLVVLGTTGESSTLNANERRDIWKFVAESVEENIHLVAGLGGNSTAEVSSQMRAFNTDHYDAFLSVSPYYNKPSQEGIYQHYMQLAEVAPLPIIIYNVPGRTGSNITSETTLKLAAATKRFIGIKEASGNFSQIMRIIKDRPSENF
ncbi:MAG: dihydrodipicolinate synthase family protein, partial [Chitinophagales bacterium]